MSEILRTYFDKWLAITEQQRAYITMLMNSQKFPLQEVVDLLNAFYLEEHPVEVPE